MIYKFKKLVKLISRANKISIKKYFISSFNTEVRINEELKKLKKPFARIGNLRA